MRFSRDLPQPLWGTSYRVRCPYRYPYHQMSSIKTTVGSKRVPIRSLRVSINSLLRYSRYFFSLGWFKFGGVEFFKINITKKMGDQAAWDSKTSIYLASAAMAEFIADVFLCPLEACRIRLVSEPTFADSLPATASRLVKEEFIYRPAVPPQGLNLVSYQRTSFSFKTCKGRSRDGVSS